jgi:predicted RNA-binding protein with PIN domain
VARPDGTDEVKGAVVPDLVSRAVAHGLLRSALELAVVVARTGTDARPPSPPPGALRPLLHHAKWTARSMARVAGVIESDDEFRQRVAEAAERLDAATLGGASRLWLVRPDGWESELADAVAALDDAAEQQRSDKEERQARRQVSGLTEELERRRVELEVAGQRAAAAEAEVAEARRERREALCRIDALAAALAEAERAAVQWREAAGRFESSAVAQVEAVQDAQEELDRLRHERRSLLGQAAALEAALAAERGSRSSEVAAADKMAATVAQAVGDAAAAAQALGAALGVAAQTLVERSSPTPASPPPAVPPSPPSAGVASRPGVVSWGGASAASDAVAPIRTAASVRPAASPVVAHRSATASLSLVSRIDGPGRGVRRPVRRPLGLPPAVFEDSHEAAAHLVRSGVLLLVDGYNVSLFAWPELALSAQRQRMATALAELAARSGAAVQVVFDGDEQMAYPSVRGTARTPVRVVFSTPGVDADEVIIDLVDQHPPDRAVVVATNDRRVQDEVRRRGANVLTTPQLLGLLRRAGPRGPM